MNRMSTISLTLCLSAFWISLLGQNIVPNPGFEKSDKKPRFMSTSGIDFERAIRKWTVPNEATTDLITPRFDSKNLTTIPPRSGNNMVGIVVNGDYWAEYACVELKEPIKPGQTYYVEYWIFHAELLF